MAEPAYLKVSCGTCDGHIAYQAASAGQTVSCPHCSKDVFLPYQSVAPDILEPTVVNSDYPQNFRRPAAPPTIRPSNQSLSISPQKNRSEGDSQTAAILVVLGLICYAFGAVDFMGMFFHYDITGVSWSPIIAGIVGSIFFSVANTKRKSFTAEKTNAGVVVGVVAALIGVVAVASIFYFASAARPTASPPPQSQTAQVEVPQPVRQPAPVQQPETQPPEAPEPMEQPVPTRLNYDWNTTEIDAIKNGNIGVAVNWLNRSPAIRSAAIAPQPQYIAKAPFNYFGKVVKVAGTVGVVQDFPAGSDSALDGQATSDIVIECEDGTIAESFCMKPSGNITTGCTVILYGYPVGVTEVPNRNGGNDTHLILVGNDYDNYGLRN
jgi:hypothetical protein